MSFNAHADLAISLIAVAPSPASSGTTLSVTAGQGARFPAAPFNAVVYPAGEIPTRDNAEIVQVTSKGSGDTFTIVRQQGTPATSARSIHVGDQIHAGNTADEIIAVENAIPSIAGLLSAVNISAGTTSNNLAALTFNNGNGVTFGLDASTVTASVATNYQSQGAYLTTAALSQDSSKYAGTNGAITGGSITVNTDGVSVNLPAYLTTAARSQDSSNYAGVNGAITGGSITVNTAGVSVNLPAYLTTAMQSNAVTLSNIKISAGAASANLSAFTLSNSNGLAFGLNGSTITGSYTVPTVTAGSDTLGISNLGNTSGTSGVVSGDSVRVLFAGGNNITLSQSVNGVSATITISGANAAGAQTGISGLVVSDATYTSGTVSFSNAGNITIASSVNGATQYIKLSGNAAQTTQSAIKGFGVSNTGQTAGNTGISTGIDWVLAGSNSITLSQSTAAGGPNTVWVQHPAWLTTAMASNRGSDFVQATAGFHGTNASGTIASDGISVSVNAGGGDAIRGIAANGSTASTNTVLFSNANGVSFGFGAAGNSTVLTASVATQSNQTVGLYASSNTYLTSSGTVDARSLSFRGDKSITVGISSGEVLFSVGAYLTTAALSQDSSKYAGINGAITGGSITVNTSGVSVNLPAYISTQSTQFLALTLGGNTAGTTTFHATNNASLFLNGGNNITLSGNGSTVTISAAAQTNQSAIKGFGVSNTGQTAGNTGLSTGIDWILAGSNSITLSQSTAGGGPNTVWIQHPAWITTARASTDAIGLNTAKTNVTWTVNSSGLSLDAGGYAGTGTSATNASITLNTNGLAISVAAPGAAAENNWFALTGNTSGNTTASGSTIALSGGNGVTLSGTNNSVIGIAVSTYSTVGTATTVYPVATANSIGTVTRWAAEDHRHGPIVVSSYEPYPAVGLSTSLVGVPTTTSASISIFPFQINQFVSAGVVNLAYSMGFVTVGTSSGRQTYGMAMGLYTLNGSTLSSLASTSLSWQVTGNNSTYSINQVTATNYTGYGATAQTSSAGVNISSGYTGMKLVGFPINLLLTPGQYYLGFLGTGSTSSVNVGISFSYLGAVMGTGLSGMAPVGSFSTAYSRGQSPFGGRWDVGQGLWQSAGSVTNVVASMDMTSVSAAGLTYPIMQFWST